MPTAARKARKRAGVSFQHPVKEGTPVQKRSSNQRILDNVTFKYVQALMRSKRFGEVMSA